MPSVYDVLQHKGYDVHCVRPGDTVLDAVRLMNRMRCGAVVVEERERVLGVFTERDVLRRVVGELRDPMTTPVRDVMTDEVLTIAPDADLGDVARIMQHRRVRHLPVVDAAGRLMGVISIGDVNAVHASQQEATIQQLNDYVFGRG